MSLPLSQVNVTTLMQQVRKLVDQVARLRGLESASQVQYVAAEIIKSCACCVCVSSLSIFFSFLSLFSLCLSFCLSLSSLDSRFSTFLSLSLSPSAVDHFLVSMRTRNAEMTDE